MTTIIPLGDGREAVVSADLGKIRVSLWGNRGSIGLEMDRKQANELRRALFEAIYANPGELPC